MVYKRCLLAFRLTSTPGRQVEQLGGDGKSGQMCRAPREGADEGIVDVKAYNVSDG
jgi:hypothetical protein